jgi:hypothetical protein
MLSLEKALPTLSATEPPKTNVQTPEFEWSDDREQFPKPIITAGADFQPVPGKEMPVPEISDVKHEENLPAIKQKTNQNSDIERIIVFFTDGTFRSYVG